MHGRHILFEIIGFFVPRNSNEQMLIKVVQCTLHTRLFISIIISIIMTTISAKTTKMQGLSADGVGWEWGDQTKHSFSTFLSRLWVFESCESMGPYERWRLSTSHSFGVQICQVEISIWSQPVRNWALFYHRVRGMGVPGENQAQEKCPATVAWDLNSRAYHVKRPAIQY